MSGIQSKVTRHKKQQENKIHDEKNQSMEIDPGLTHMMELQTNILKTFNITAFHMFKKLTRRLESIRKGPY